jgi:ABC-type sugar transport system ATPase subunit
MTVSSGFELRAIVKAYGAVVAVDGVTLKVRPGEVHAIVGENGAGKSTLMKILSGALPRWNFARLPLRLRRASP